jgi:hypothetical protein
LQLAVFAVFVLVLGADPFTFVRAVEFPGPEPGEARARWDGRRLVMENQILTTSWDFGPEGRGLAEVVDRLAGRTYRPRTSDACEVRLADGRSIPLSKLRRTGKPELTKLDAQPDSVRQCGRFAGWAFTLPCLSDDSTFRLDWQILLRDGSNYIQQRVTLHAAEKPLLVEEVTLLELHAPTAEVGGKVVGSPIVADTLFVSCEHPMANNRIADGQVICSASRYRPVEPDEPWTVSSVIGVVPDGQLRRGFLYYLERERARPYRPFVYYISWFDIAYAGRKMTEPECLARIDTFGEQLAVKRGIKLDAFVFDDGWDDYRTLWQFHQGFPDGFAPLASRAAKYGAVLGTWISPWGGYGKAKAERLEFGKAEGFETNRAGLSLAGPNYYDRFRDVCRDHMDRYGVAYFKFDGIGQGDSTRGPSEEYRADLEALLQLIDDLRRTRPDVFVNTTVGTWPSPYWLWHSDSIWRGAADTGHHGAGSGRQQWLTYRDMQAYRRQVLPAPLYPLNSLKFQSVINAPLGVAAKISGNLKDLIDDIRMAAGSGTQLQEFFVTPSRMSPEAWDAVARTIKWMRASADVLVDSHWIGGDPGKGEVYGFASWSPRKGILVLRNPSDRGAQFQVDLESAFELPASALREYRLESPWTDFRQRIAIAGQPFTVELAPLEVLVLEAIPDSPRATTDSVSVGN